MPLDVDALDPDPVAQLRAWLDAAAAAGNRMPDAFALSTAGGDGAPSGRMVLLRGLGDDGLRFFTNHGSRKGRDLAANPRATATFWWPELDRQVRVAGRVSRLSDADSQRYWSSRPRASRLSALASRQGAKVGSRAVLEERVAVLGEQYPDEIPLPEFWGGYLLEPAAWEFWESRPNRLHDRIEYLPNPSGGWLRRRLQP